MTLDERTIIINAISRTLSIMMCDIKLHQSMNDLSMNIHAEDFFCNVFNLLYTDKNFENANSAGKNEAHIDLIDSKSKHVIQITTTTTKGKIDNSFKIFDSKDADYSGYILEIYYLLEKPAKNQKNTISEYQKKYGIKDINTHLKDYTNLLGDIKSLSDERLQGVYSNHFKDINEKYTDEIALQIVFDSLVKNEHPATIDYSSDFSNVGLEDKIKLNRLNSKVSFYLLSGSEASIAIYENVETDTITTLRQLLVDEWYNSILKTALKSIGKTSKELANKSTSELHLLAVNGGELIDFSAILGQLCKHIESKTKKSTYQENAMAWVVIAYFFEECDIGVKA